MCCNSIFGHRLSILSSLVVNKNKMYSRTGASPSDTVLCHNQNTNLPSATAFKHL